MKISREILVKIMDIDKFHDIGEIMVAPCGKLQLNQRSQIEKLDFLNALRDLVRIGKRDRSRFSRTWKMPAHQHVQCDPVRSVEKAPGSSFDLDIVFRNKSLLEFREPFWSQ